MKTNIIKSLKITGWTLIAIILTLFALMNLLGIIFFAGLWYRDVFM